MPGKSDRATDPLHKATRLRNEVTFLRRVDFLGIKSQRTVG